MKVYLICDESGAKGYSDKDEQYDGEAGVFAGIFITEDMIEPIKEQLSNIASKYFTDEKYHLTSLPDDKKESLRLDIYKIIRDENLKCIYEAIHVSGFYAEHKRIDILQEETKITSDIKTSNNTNKDSLHVELFQNLACKAIAYCIDNFNNNYELIFLSDNIDGTILKHFKRSVEKITTVSSPVEYTNKGYHTKKKEVITQTIEITVDIPKSYGFLDIESTVYEIKIEPKISGLTLMADILANSINYIFSSREKQDVGKPLNDKDSINGHPLIENYLPITHFYGLRNKQDQAWFSDIVYMHPNERDRLKLNS